MNEDKKIIKRYIIISILILLITIALCGFIIAENETNNIIIG